MKARNSNSILEDLDDETPFFLSTGDLMAALLMLFVLLLLAALIRLQREHRVEIDRTEKHAAEQASLMRLLEIEQEKTENLNEQFRQLVITYDKLQQELYDALFQEFESDIPRWHANIDRNTLSIRFQEPDVLFDQGDDHVSDRFRDILADFFPRYVAVLSAQEFVEHIEEIRIEGHTSSEWKEQTEEQMAYFHNMELSQDRTRNVLRFCLDTIRELEVKNWARSLITANGLSSSKLILDELGEEDGPRSRRVEFRVRTDAERRIAEILSLARESTD